ncbi:MAG: PAN domain-containing protein [Rubrivivax sp.]|nr:PAN domain-containing protein [Rubrivivax sp.]
MPGSAPPDHALFAMTTTMRKKSMKTWSAIRAVLAGVALGVGLPVVAQQPPAPERAAVPLQARDTDWRTFRAAPRVAPPLPAQRVEIMERRAAIAHQPFPMLRPGTNAPIAPTEMIVLPNGRSVPASEYYAQLNKLESDLNARGFSLRSRERRVMLQRTRPNPALYEQQRAAVQRTAVPRTQLRLSSPPLVPLRRATANVVPNEPARSAVLSAAERSQQLRLSPARVEQLVLAGQLPLSVDTPQAAQLMNSPGKTWWTEAGEQDIAYVYLDAKVVHGFDGDALRMGGGANAFIKLLGQKIPVLDAEVLAVSGSTGNRLRMAARTVSGELFPTVEESSQPRRELPQETGFDEKVSFTLPIGPIPVTVNLGARGKVGLYAMLEAHDRMVHGKFGPYAELSAYAEAGVDLVVAGAGAEFNLVLLKESLMLEGEARVTGHFAPQVQNAGMSTFQGRPVRVFDKATAPELRMWYAADNTLTLMSGSVGIYAFIMLPNLALPPWDRHEFHHTLASWPGLTFDSRIFGMDEVRIPLTRQLTEPEMGALRTAATLLGARAQVTRPITLPQPAPPVPSPLDRQMRPVVPVGIERSTNRPGGDYRGFVPATEAQCQSTCASEAQCRAWTWVAPGIQGPQARCWLKNVVPPPSRSDCCSSGVK